jgi:PAS domain S-box-containing protein
MNQAGVVTDWSARATDTFGWSSEQIVGKPLADVVISPQDRAVYTEELARLRSTTRTHELSDMVEISALRRDGQEFAAELAISSSEGEGGTVFIAFIRDITDRKAAERRQTDLVEHLKSSNGAMRDFSNLVVHELRSPLAVISGYAALMIDGSLQPGTPTWDRALSEIAGKTTEALGLADDLLLSSRLDASVLIPKLAHVNLRAIAAAALERGAASAQLAGADLQVEAGFEAAEAVADAGMVGQIIDNLIQNALAYGGTPARVRIRVSADPCPIVSVEDGGPGVPAELRETIFRRFSRGAQRASVPGTGLGLYLSQQLAQLQGGSLKLDWSEEGRGCCFSLRLLPDRRVATRVELASPAA